MDTELFLSGFLAKKQLLKIKQRKKKWTPEGLARLRAAALTNKPWEKSTGPKTEAGKAISSRNNTRHGGYSREMLEIRRLIHQLQVHAPGKL